VRSRRNEALWSVSWIERLSSLKPIFTQGIIMSATARHARDYTSQWNWQGAWTSLLRCGSEERPTRGQADMKFECKFFPHSARSAHFVSRNQSLLDSLPLRKSHTSAFEHLTSFFEPNKQSFITRRTLPSFSQNNRVSDGTGPVLFQVPF
jgi:hypothetical protein